MVHKPGPRHKVLSENRAKSHMPVRVAKIKIDLGKC